MFGSMPNITESDAVRVEQNVMQDDVAMGINLQLKDEHLRATHTSHIE